MLRISVFIVFMLFAISVFLSGCLKSDSEKIAPFFDGLKLSYTSCSGNDITIFTYEKVDDDMFLVKVEYPMITPDLKDYYREKKAITEFEVDKFGLTPHGSVYGFGNELWLPYSDRKKGKTVTLSSFGRKGWRGILKGPENWKEWDVWVLESSTLQGNIMNYYDYSTGFYVGRGGTGQFGGWCRILIESNVEGL